MKAIKTPIIKEYSIGIPKLFSIPSAIPLTIAPIYFKLSIYFSKPKHLPDKFIECVK